MRGGFFLIQILPLNYERSTKLSGLFYSIYTVLCAVGKRRVGQSHMCGGLMSIAYTFGIWHVRAPAVGGFV